MLGRPALTFFVLVLGSFLFSGCIEKEPYTPKSYIKPLEVVKLSDHSYMHICYVKTEKGNFIACNGYIYVDEGEAIIFDTPVNDSISQQLIDFVRNDLKLTIKGVVVNHSHLDAAGGLSAFIKANIPSYASIQTADLLKQDSLIISHPFKDTQTIQMKGSTIENRYVGEAHVSDNIVSYMPKEHLLFGGCMIKAHGAERGNLEDANLEAWSETVAAVKDYFPEVKIVIPGHGLNGDATLLDYTIELFKIQEYLGDNLD
ncbi:MAG: metallo-beta-lactamase class B [Flavobacteriales bacterium]|jgi:metallo-beta-lactamase class B